MSDKKIKSIFIQIRTSSEEEWETICAKGTRYTNQEETIREYDFNDFWEAIANERYYNWEHTYFKASRSLFRRIKTLDCLLKNIRMTEESCSKIYVREIAFSVDISSTNIEALKEVLPAKDFIEFVKDNWITT